jgi:hypothetical protein
LDCCNSRAATPEGAAAFSLLNDRSSFLKSTPAAKPRYLSQAIFANSSSVVSLKFVEKQPQVLRLRLPLNHPSDVDLSLGAPGYAANFAQDDSFLICELRRLGTSLRLGFYCAAT